VTPFSPLSQPNPLTNPNASNSATVIATFANSTDAGATLTIARTPTVNLSLTAYRTGDNFGTAVSQSLQQGGDPANYVILTNNNFDEHPDLSQADYADGTALIGADHDLAKITLDQLPAGVHSGTVSLSLSDPTGARFFKEDGTELTTLTLDLSNPTGYLAGLLSGNVNVWVEGLHESGHDVYV